MTNLTIFERQLPLRAYPSNDLDKLLETEFKFWIANLLNLKSDKEEAYNNAKEALKFHCIGMGFNEIKIMFEMYADSKLNIEPTSNYFDRIVLGKIVNAYKKQRKPKKVEEEKKPTAEEEHKAIEEAITRTFLEFKRTGTVTGVITHIYNYLDAQGKFQGGRLDEEWKGYKWKVFRFCEKIVKENKNYNKLGVILEDAKTMSKRKILIKYYKGL